LVNAAKDVRYGAPLGGTTPTRFDHLGAFDTANSDYGDLRALFAEIPVGRDDVVVAIGCGKGRALNWFLARTSAQRIYGIELDPTIAERAAHRLRRHPSVTVLAGDAPSLLPADATLLYLFNPFGESVMRRLVTSVVRLPDCRRIVYNNCKYLQPFAGDPRFVVHPIAPTARHPSVLIDVHHG
jgi:hypothetical protein